ncbi:hypothetical protein BGZ76_010999 [Entomortierella beljakovae]|nr:hypothetical protein BGZ76_010999 [Entomortierella beljakovae]
MNMHRSTIVFLSATKRISSAQQILRNAATALAPLAPRSSLLPSRVHNGSLGMNMTMALNASCQIRGFASKKDSKKGGKGKKAASSDDDDDEDSGSRKGKGGKSSGGGSVSEMTYDPIDMEKKFAQCLERLKRDFMTMRAGTANPAILDPVMVKVEGKIVPLRDLAQVSIKDAKTLMVNVSDTELITAVEKAIREAGLNLNPIADNKAVKVPVPKPTKEFRETLTKNASTSAEKAKTIIRKLRQDGMKDLKKDLKAGMSEDENYTLEKKAQTTHDKYIKDIEDALKAKTKEIMAN